MLPANPLDDAACGLIEAAPDGTILAANIAFAQMLEHERASLLGVRFQDLLTRGGAIFYETQFSPSLLLRGVLEEISLEIVTRQGQRIPIFVNAVLRKNDPTKPQSILIAVFVARQRHQYEAELLRSRRDAEQLANVVRRSSDAIIRLSADARIESWNSGAQLIFGYQTDEALGKSLGLLFTEEEFAGITSSFAGLRRGADVNKEAIARHKCGSPIYVSVSLTPHMEAPGTLVGFSAIIRDTTKQKQAERALLQSEKLASVGRLASSVAHEINNPLESVTNLLYILSSRITDEETKGFVRMAEQELARVSQVANHTLRFHKQSTDRTEVNLHALIKSVLDLYRARLQSSAVEIVSETVDCPPLCCYENDLRHVLLNLVSNAFDAMRSGGRLTIRCRDLAEGQGKDRCVRISVSDTGSGMDQATLARIFEPFFSTKGIGGTGLGLWIAKDLITRNSGSVRVRSSSAPGRSGTTFIMWFASTTASAAKPWCVGGSEGPSGAESS